MKVLKYYFDYGAQPDESLVAVRHHQPHHLPLLGSWSVLEGLLDAEIAHDKSGQFGMYKLKIIQFITRYMSLQGLIHLLRTVPKLNEFTIAFIVGCLRDHLNLI